MFTLSPISRTHLTRRNPQTNDFYRLMNNFFNDDFFRPSVVEDSASESWQLGLDIQENEKEYILEADVPGFTKEDIQIDFKDQYLIIEAKSNKENEESKDNYIRRERCQRSYRRTLYMDDVQKDQISAKLENGVLTIIAPKAEKVDTSLKIEVQ